MVVSSQLYLLIWWWCNDQHLLTQQWTRSVFNWYITIHKTIQSPDRWLVSKSREFRSSTKVVVKTHDGLALCRNLITRGTSQFTRQSRVQTGDLFLRAESSNLQPKYITIHKTIQSPDRWLVSKSREFRSSTKHSSVCGQICFLLNLFVGLCIYSKGSSLIQESVQSSQIVTYPVLDDRSCSHLFSCILLRIWKAIIIFTPEISVPTWTSQLTVLQQWAISSCQ